jgi:hypothetical protein
LKLPAGVLSHSIRSLGAGFAGSAGGSNSRASMIWSVMSVSSGAAQSDSQ